MIFVFDGAVLSTFSKIKRFNLIPLIFGQSQLLIPEAVKKDLANSKSLLLEPIIDCGFFKETSIPNKNHKIYK